ncbi:MAG: outer membrane protein assembly factor BamA [Proteobacteria bacterium]|nr:outer membrane protein assembly factor BamA [Pseudomonadota bacterium]
MTKFSKNIAVIILLGFSLCFANISAQAAAKYNIVIKGNERIAERMVNSYLDIDGLQQGDQSAINNSLKNLYGSGLFLESNIYKDGKSLIVELKENPIIGDITFSGNKKLDDDVLLAEIQLKKRSVYTKAKLQADIKRINNIYIKSGRFLTKIDPKIVKKDQNRVDLIFNIKEGKKAKIAEIYFIGNEAFSAEDLTSEITTSKSKWYKFFSSSDSYDSDRVQFDKEKLRRFYTARGYADFAVISAIADITPAKDKFFITFLLEEGIKYDFGAINIINNVKKFDTNLLKDSIKPKQGKLYNSELVDKTVDEMVEVMAENGYAFINIEPVLKRNKEQKIIDIDFVIEETPRIYINQIEISGNHRTLDRVIRRELRIREGDPYNVIKINRSRQRLLNLGFFDKVDLKTRRVGNSDKIDLLIEVKEKKTGELNFGIGYSTVDQLTGNVGIRERNLLGTGQDLSLNIQQSKRRANNTISYTIPYFTGREIDFGIDLFNSKVNKFNSFAFDQENNGFVIRGDYSISEHLRHQLRYSYKDEKISNVDNNVSFAIQNLEGDNQTSSIGHTLSFDKRDNRFDPREGYFVNLSQDYAGLGGNIDYVKHQGKASYYLPIVNKDFVLKFSGSFGYIDGLGQDVRSNNNFFLGGNNFRGFENAGIGPRTADADGNANGGSAIGGRLFYVYTTEFRFPIGLPKDLGISTSLFSDIGTLKMVDSVNKNSINVVDTGSLRASYGLSIIWSSPMGPIRLDFSKVQKREDFDRVQNFRFSFGTNF